MDVPISVLHDVQASIAEGQNAKSELTGGSTFFWLLFFVHAKKSNSRQGAKPLLAEW